MSFLNKADKKMADDGSSILADSRIEVLKLTILQNFISGPALSEKEQNKE